VKRFDARRVKIHRSYAVDEAARVLRSHKNTIRNWLKRGLPTVDTHRPHLIRGADLKEFVTAKQMRGKTRCRGGQLYCVRCRAAKQPARQIAEYLPITPTSGNLRGSCPDCGTRIFRRVSLRQLASATGDLAVLVPQGQQRITDWAALSPSCDLKAEADSDADA
jgi:hypothetical protein